jgi:glycerol-3-phosphate dehydrogenase
MPDEFGKGIVATPSYSYNYLVGPNSNSSEDRDDLGTERETMDYIKRQALKLVPNIPFDKVIRTFSGLRATPSGGDFIIGPAEGHPVSSTWRHRIAGIGVGPGHRRIRS